MFYAVSCHFKYRGYSVASKFFNSAGSGSIPIKVTKRNVDAVTPTDREQWLWDSEVKGFRLRVRPNANRSYVLEYRPGDGGRGVQKRRITIGPHGSPWTPDSARTEAIRLLGIIRNGGDPMLERVSRRRAPDTFELVGAIFIERYAKGHQRSWSETERVFLRDLNPVFGSAQVGAISKQDILRFIDDRAQSAPLMANRTLAYLKNSLIGARSVAFAITIPVMGSACLVGETPATER